MASNTLQNHCISFSSLSQQPRRKRKTHIRGLFFSSFFQNLLPFSQPLALEMESSSSEAGAKDKVIKAAKSIKKNGQDDPRRIIHSLKVGLALTMVSLIYYFKPLYDDFGVAGMWAVLTVVVVFDFTVGGTLSKGLNRGFATLFAGALACGAKHLASLFGEKGEPIVLGILVFLLAAASTFMRFFPRIKARYDYGITIFILTFSLVAVSGYRVDEILELAHQRLSTIIIGGSACIVVSMCVCPVWAGEDLHKLIASNIEKLASYLEGFGAEYFQCSVDGDKSFLQGYKSVLNSKSTEESTVNLARWEPSHGRFRLRHPWKQYLKIGALARQCAYQIEALNGCINSNTQAQQEFQNRIQEPCTKISEEAGKALKLLSSAIKTMTDPSSAVTHVDNSKNSMEDLNNALKASTLVQTDLLSIVPAATVASVLIEIVKTVEELCESVRELSNLAHFKSVEPTVSPEEVPMPQLLRHRKSVKPVVDGDGGVDINVGDHVVITIYDSAENENVGQAPKAAGQLVEM